jgi:hypothetical protein
MIEIPLDGRTWEVRLPSRAVQRDILVASGTNVERAHAAALGLCLVLAGTAKDKNPVQFYPDLSYLSVGCNALVYGGAIDDEAYRRRIPTKTFADAAAQCFDAVDEAFEIITMPTGEEVDAAEGFTGHPPGSGTG